MCQSSIKVEPIINNAVRNIAIPIVSNPFHVPTDNNIPPTITMNTNEIIAIPIIRLIDIKTSFSVLNKKLCNAVNPTGTA